MAKDRPDVVELPKSDFEALLQRLERLEHAQRVRAESEDTLHPKALYDERWDARVAEAGKSAAQRTQERSDRDYGTRGPRWLVWLDSTREDGKPGPDVSEWPRLVISANSPEEATARWLILCGVRAHQYQLRAEPAQPQAA